MATAVPSSDRLWSSSNRFTMKLGFLSALLGTVMAMGLVSNQLAYLFIPFLAFTLYWSRQDNLRSQHFWFLIATLFLALYGTVIGILNGNNLNFVLRFTAPLLAFAIFLPARGLGTVFFTYRRELNVLIFAFSLFVFLLTSLGLNQLSLLLLRGWTFSFWTASAVSIWHYFALPFAAVMIYEFLHFKRTGRSLLHAALGAGTVVLLWLTTATTAFTLACLIMVFAIFAPRIRVTFLSRGLLFVAMALMIDYVTLQVVSDWFYDWLTQGLTDEGDSIRLLQINYFLNGITLVGHGFGVEHDFVFDSYNRQESHSAFPYASELPVLNLIHGGGFPAVVWFGFVLVTAFRLFRNLVASRHPQLRLYSLFSFGCMMALIGSISNPFLFSPISMLLIAMGFNGIEQYERMRQSVLDKPD